MDIAALQLLEAWLSEEGVETGARCVHHMEFDSNWSDGFRVVLLDKSTEPPIEYVGGGPRMVGGLAIAIRDALARGAAHAE